MVIPTLPTIGVAPPFMLFQTMNWVAISLASVLFVAAIVSTLVVIPPLILYCINPSSETRQQCGLDNCRRCMNPLFLFLGRPLCVYTFPALFKMHKTRDDSERLQTTKLMLFLDRKVERNVSLIAAFCSIVCCIFFISAAVFFQYFPVEESTECLEKDNHGRTLFCYSNSSLTNPSFPVDCANYSTTDLRELQFQCYAIALPVGLGIAVAAAFGLAEVGIVGVTIFVKVTEGIFNKIRRRHCCSCCNSSHANCICIISSIVLIMIVFVTSSSFAIYTSINFPEADKMQPLHILYYFAYLFLPMLVCIPLIYIALNLKDHCDKGEFISIAEDQWPPDERRQRQEQQQGQFSTNQSDLEDREQGSNESTGSGQHYIANSMQEEGGHINEDHEENGALLIDDRDNTEFTEDGETQF